MGADHPESAGREGPPAAPGDSSAAHQVTGLLQAWGRGSLEARDRLLPLIYRDLRRRAAARLRHERPGHTLQPTALVNEAYMRLVDQQRVVWHDRAHFFAVAAQMMRRILVDYARSRARAKRPGGAVRVTLDDRIGAEKPFDAELLEIDRALDELAALDERQGRIVELRYFGGLTDDEVAAVLGISRSTVTREWQIARGWLYRRITTGRRPT
jgi:RNA polymerase sigma factor (TIGR02999 family)